MILLGFALASPPEHIEWRRGTVAELLDAGEPDAQLARSLGRLRDPLARPHLERMWATLDSHDAIAWAMGQTPGGAPTLRRWWDDAAEEDRVALARALGRAGDERDVARLMPMLRASWPVGESSALGLADLARRGVDVPVKPVIEALRNADPLMIEGLAVLMSRQIVPTEDRAFVRILARTAPTTGARIALHRALQRGGGDPEALRWALRGTPIEVAVALGFSDDPEEGLRRVDHAHPLVRVAAYALAGKADGGTERMMRRAGQSGAHERALISHALGPDPTYLDEDLNPWLRGAQVRHLQDLDALVGFAGASATPVRTAAIERLVELEAAPEVWRPLLESSDAVVRAAAFEASGDRPGAAYIEDAILTLRVESDPSALLAGLVAVRRWWDADRRAVPIDRFVRSTLRRASRSDAPAIRRAARRMAEAAGVPYTPGPWSDQVRELILPDGTVTTTTGDLPVLDEVHAIGSAIVTTNRGAFTIELAPDVAPLAVHDFASLARAGFYAGLRWHRLVPGFVAQGGCPRGDGWGGPGWLLVDEPSDAPFVRGSVGLARGDFDTNGSQFFVTTARAPHLEGLYTHFGTVVDAMGVVDRLGPDDWIESIQIEER